MPRFLHISDLHRSPDDPVDNHALIAALDCDFESQLREDPSIGSIDAVIVSGDVIQGVRLGETNSQSKIREQYAVASEFLDELSTRYLSGDRSKIVIVPGNHDVDWNVAASAMAEVPRDKQEENLLQYLSQPNFRFCYRTRRLFLVHDLALYENRFDEFNKFLVDFYEDANLAYPISSEKYFNLFELNNGRIVVAAFNSCYLNDCYRYAGSIPDGAIGKSYLNIKDSGRDYDLRMAVWHHSLHGPPNAADYMDVELVREMTSRHFQLGLHGHQHRIDAYPERIFLPTEEHIVVVSAGSLCVGARELPAGEKRQYNILEVNSDYSSIRVHVREMILERAFGPRRLAAFGGNSYINLDLAPKPETDSQVTESVLFAERLIAQGNYDKAVEEMERFLGRLPAHGRRLLLSACEDGKYWDRLIELFAEPTTISELLALVGAHEELGEPANGKLALDTFAVVVGLQNSQRQEIESRLDIAVRMKL